VKTTIQHPILGQIEYEDVTHQVMVQHGDLAERITWLLKPKNYDLLGHGYYPNYFIRPCEVVGIMLGAESTTTQREEPLPHASIKSIDFFVHICNPTDLGSVLFDNHSKRRWP
jgi:hypothetical protein